jgi:hypothetical protein
MRWTPGGAQAVLDLRAVRRNGHWEAYGPLHRHQQHQRLYGRAVPAPALAEAKRWSGLPDEPPVHEFWSHSNFIAHTTLAVVAGAVATSRSDESDMRHSFTLPRISTAR